MGYALCYSDAAKKTFLEDEEVSMCACVYTCVYMYVYTCVYVSVCMCAHVCVHTCVCIQYMHSCITQLYVRDGTIQASRVLMHHVKSITI